MSNLFDSLQLGASIVVGNTMGYDASWTPSIGNLPVNYGRVLLKEPTEKDNLNGVEYNPFIYLIEYFKGTFEGLMIASRQGSIEVIQIDSTSYEVRIIKATHDGKSYIAICEKIG